MQPIYEADKVHCNVHITPPGLARVRKINVTESHALNIFLQVENKIVLSTNSYLFDILHYLVFILSNNI